MKIPLRLLLPLLTGAIVFANLSPAHAQANYVHPNEQVEVRSKSVNIDVARLDGTWVSQADEARQGSIVKLFNPFYEGPDPDAKADEPQEEPNEKLNIRLMWPTDKAITLAKLEEKISAPSYPENQGVIRLFDEDDILKTENSISLTLQGDGKQYLRDWNQGKILQIELRRSAIVTLKFAVTLADASEPIYDEIRITSVPDKPGNGRILFVRTGAEPSGSGQAAVFDDYFRNAAAHVADAVEVAPEGANVVVGPGHYLENNIEIKKSLNIFGIGGNYDAAVESTQFNCDGLPRIDGNHQGRLFLVATTSANDKVLLSGLLVCNGSAGEGGAVLYPETSEGSFRVSCCSFEDNEATGVPTDTTLLSPHVSGATKQNAPPPGGVKKKGGGGAIAFHARVVIRGGTSPSLPFPGYNRTAFKSCKSADLGGAAFLSIDSYKDANLFGYERTIVNMTYNRDEELPLIPGRNVMFFKKCIFLKNTARLGGAIASSETFPYAGMSPYAPAEVRMTGGMPISVVDSVFDGNGALAGGISKLPSASRGGAIYLAGINSSGSRILGCEFRRNYANGISNDPSSLSDGDGGAIVVAFMATVTIGPHRGRPSVFTNNSADDGGGAIYATYFAAVKVFSTNINANKGGTGAGAIHISSGASVKLVSCTIDSNHGGVGGGIYNRNARVDVISCTISKNKADDEGGGVYELAADDGGTPPEGPGSGAPWPESAVSPAITRIIEGTKITGNSAKNGGGVYVFRDYVQKENAYMNPNRKILKIDIINSSVSNNMATGPGKHVAGGIFFSRSDDEYFFKNQNIDIESDTAGNLQQAFGGRTGPIRRWSHSETPLHTNNMSAGRYAFELLSLELHGNHRFRVDTITGNKFFNNSGWQAATADGGSLKMVELAGNEYASSKEPACSPEGLLGPE